MITSGWINEKEKESSENIRVFKMVMRKSTWKEEV